MAFIVRVRNTRPANSGWRTEPGSERRIPAVRRFAIPIPLRGTSTWAVPWGLAAMVSSVLGQEHFDLVCRRLVAHLR